MGSCSQIRSVDEYRCSQEGLYQIVGFLHGKRAPLTEESVFQQIHDWACLLPLEEVDDADQVIKETEAGVHRASLPSRSADALAFPAATQKIDWPVELQ